MLSPSEHLSLGCCTKYRIHHHERICVPCTKCIPPNRSVSSSTAGPPETSQKAVPSTVNSSSERWKIEARRSSSFSVSALIAAGTAASALMTPSRPPARWTRLLSCLRCLPASSPSVPSTSAPHFRRAVGARTTIASPGVVSASTTKPITNAGIGVRIVGSLGRRLSLFAARVGPLSLPRRTPGAGLVRALSW